jgi:hypothetical protein
MQTAIAGPISLTANVVQLLQQVAELIKILQPDNVFIMDRRIARLGHSRIMVKHARWRNPEIMYFSSRKCRAEHHWLRPLCISLHFPKHGTEDWATAAPIARSR